MYRYYIHRYPDAPTYLHTYVPTYHTSRLQAFLEHIPTGLQFSEHSWALCQLQYWETAEHGACLQLSLNSQVIQEEEDEGNQPGDLIQRLLEERPVEEEEGAAWCLCWWLRSWVLYLFLGVVGVVCLCSREFCMLRSLRPPHHTPSCLGRR